MLSLLGPVLRKSRCLSSIFNVFVIPPWSWWNHNDHIRMKRTYTSLLNTGQQQCAFTASSMSCYSTYYEVLNLSYQGCFFEPIYWNRSMSAAHCSQQYSSWSLYSWYVVNILLASGILFHAFNDCFKETNNSKRVYYNRSYSHVLLYLMGKEAKLVIKTRRTHINADYSSLLQPGMIWLVSPHYIM